MIEPTANQKELRTQEMIEAAQLRRLVEQMRENGLTSVTATTLLRIADDLTAPWDDTRWGAR